MKGGFNSYVYANDNPILNGDRLGLCKWSGKFTYVGGSARIYGGMLGQLKLESECCNGKKSTSTCNIMAGGFSGGAPVQIASAGFSSLLGPDTPSWEDPQGAFSYFSVTASVPFIGGRSSSFISCGKLASLETGSASGFDMGADAIAGYANCWGEDKCCDQ